MRRQSIFTFGSQVFTTTWPVMPWIPSDDTIGGWRDADSGVPASYVVRRDALIDLTIRLDESEWTTFLNLITHGQSAQSITWTPDTEDLATVFEVYLVSPKPGERMTPSRNSDYPRLFEVTITLRGKAGAVPWLPYFTVN